MNEIKPESTLLPLTETEAGIADRIFSIRGVHVMRGAVVRNAVIMQDGYIMPGAHVEGCILDKQVTVRDHVTLCAPVSYPVVIGKGITV